MTGKDLMNLIILLWFIFSIYLIKTEKVDIRHEDNIEEIMCVVSIFVFIVNFGIQLGILIAYNWDKALF